MRLLVNVEGQTEENFVNLVLAPHLQVFGYHHVSARILGNPRNTARGGICGWPQAKNDIQRRALQDRKLRQTTFVDFYAMPASGQRAWPGRAEATGETGAAKAAMVESAMLEDLRRTLGEDCWPIRFEPFIAVHEFEALLFSDCGKLAEAMDKPSLTAQLQAIRDAFATPEEINDSPESSPSHRLMKFNPGYTKPVLGIRAAKRMGLSTIRKNCPHFDAWIGRLERWAKEG